MDAFREQAAEDLGLLVLLHYREASAEVLDALRERGAEGLLRLPLTSAAGRRGLERLEAALRALPKAIAPADIDALAADYAAIYLTHACRASPCESVWFDDEGLERQAPYFQTRDWYRRQGLAVSRSDVLPDDHLVHQLRFVVHLLDAGEGTEGLDELARFLDEHPLRWIPLFAERVERMTGSEFYRGLALVTRAVLDELRDRIAAAGGPPLPGEAWIAATLAGKRKVNGCGTAENPCSG